MQETIKLEFSLEQVNLIRELTEFYYQFHKTDRRFRKQLDLLDDVEQIILKEVLKDE